MFIHRRLRGDGSSVGLPALSTLPGDETEYQDSEVEEEEEEEEESNGDDERKVGMGYAVSSPHDSALLKRKSLRR